MSELADMEILDSENDDLGKVVVGLDPTAVDLMRLNQQQRTFTESSDLYEVEEITLPIIEPKLNRETLNPLQEAQVEQCKIENPENFNLNSKSTVDEGIAEIKLVKSEELNID